MKELWSGKSLIFCIYLLTLRHCCSLNDEGLALLRVKERVRSDPYGALSNWVHQIGVETPCSWTGVECSRGSVVALNLEDLSLNATLPPDIGNLVHVKAIILRNNSFWGVIPREIANLKELEVLDIGHNNLSGQIPCELADNLSMSILLLDNNELLSSRCPQISQLESLSQLQVSTNHLQIYWNSDKTGDVGRRKLSQEDPFTRRDDFLFPFFPPPPEEPIPPPQESIPPPETSSSPAPSPEPLLLVPSPSPTIQPISPSPPIPAGGAVSPKESSKRHSHRLLIVSAAAGGSLLLLLIIGIYFWQSGKVSTVKPWATGISGQLQRAFITGVPKLKRSELEAACEDFSNVIGSASLCTLYKGTLSSGVEIAVASVAVTSAKGWSNNMEAQFREKIDTLSKVNHKNFVSLLGYCEEAEPFTRMMVFEYAPNGTLFEHIHISEAEHLDWKMRLRIAMGMAYCLEHMHQLTPPLVHQNFKSAAVYLTEDYAAKVSDFSLLDEGSSSDANLQSNVYSFGVVLFEMVTGKLPYSAGGDWHQDWASDYLSSLPSLRDIVDPTLETYKEDEVEQIRGVIRGCTYPDPRERWSMREACERLREITGIQPDGAVPRLSPLWWAELEVLSNDPS